MFHFIYLKKLKMLKLALKENQIAFLSIKSNWYSTKSKIENKTKSGNVKKIDKNSGD